MAKFHLLNGAFVTQEEAVLPITDLSILRGYAVFDYFRVIDGVPLFIDLHIDRFIRSAEYLDLELPFDKDKMTGHVHKLIEKNEMIMGAMRLLATGGCSDDGYSLAKPNIVFQAMDYPHFPKHFNDNGVKILLEEYVRENPLIKSTNYIHGLQLKKKLNETGNDFVLYHHNGIISESDRSNFFIISQEGELCTPKKDILHGITRHNIINLMKEEMPVSIRPITLADLKQAKEAFISSSAKGVMAVVAVDGQPIGDGTIGATTTLISDKYERYIREYVDSNGD